METIIKIAAFILSSFVHIWPYLLITIPLAVGLKLSGVSKHINKVFTRNPYISILLATAIGAISPFCSCGVIPVIASLLIGGVPLAPVMSFWIASPSMDPEIFFLSAATIGWQLSVWRLVATFVISLSAGLITHLAYKRGFFGEDILRKNPLNSHSKLSGNFYYGSTQYAKRVYRYLFSNKRRSVQLSVLSHGSNKSTLVNCCISVEMESNTSSSALRDKVCECDCSSEKQKETFLRKLIKETWSAFFMVAKFMTLAFLLNAIIQFYLPKDAVSNFIGGGGPFSVIIAALVGIPFYTSNLTALPLVSGLLSLGMNKGAALAFLIAGPVTTLPAMMAVWGIVKPRVFLFI